MELRSGEVVRAYVKPTGPPPQCRCGVDALLRESLTDRNPYRWFYRCGDRSKCGYFKWADELTAADRAPAGPRLQQQSPQQPQQQQPQQQSQGLPRYTESPGQQQPPPQQQQQYQQYSPAAAAAAAGGGGGAGSGGGGYNQHPPGATPGMQQGAPAGYQGGGSGGGPPPGPQQWQQGQGGGSQGSQGGSQQQQWSQPPPQQQQQWPQQQQQQWSQPPPQQQQQWAQPPQQGNWQPGQAPYGQPGPSPQQQQQQPQQQQQQQQWSQGGGQQQPYAAGPFNSPARPPNNNNWAQQSPQQQQQQQPYGYNPQQQQQGWAQSPQQPPPVGQSPYQQQQQHTPVGGMPQRGMAPSPGLRVVRVVDSGPESDSVGLKLAGFDKFFVDRIKETPYGETGRSWDAAGKMWKVRRTALHQVAQYLSGHGYRLLMPGEETPAKQGGTPGGAGPSPGGGTAPPVDLLALESSNDCLIHVEAAATAAALAQSHLPPQLWNSLLPHQREGVLAGLRRGGKLLLADEMGLGKTAQAICLAACYPADWPLLVVAPTSLLAGWEVELDAWLPPALRRSDGCPHTLVIRSDKDKKRLLAAGLPLGAHILLTTYKLVQSLPTETLAHYNVVICDESHKLKNPQTVQSQFVGRVVRGARRAFLLTGTPLLSRPIEAWAQVDMLRPRFLGSYQEFGDKFCLPPNSPPPGGSASGGRPAFKQQYSGSNPATADELRRLLQANVMVRRTKGQSGVALPEKTRLRVSVSVSAASQPRLASIWSDMEALRAQGASGSPEAQRLVNEYRQATGEAKVDSVVEFIRGLPGLAAGGGGAGGGSGGGGASSSRAAAAAAAAGGGAPDDDDDDSDSEAAAAAAAAAAGAAGSSGAGGAADGSGSGSSSAPRPAGKVLVFAHHQGVLDAIQSRLCDADRLGYVRIDGRTSGPDRQAAVSRFQGSPSVWLALMSIKAAGVGLTLTAADTVVFAELDWNPTDLQQCEDRIHRVGQQQHCTIYYCVAPQSADVLMWGTLARKLRVVGATVDGAAAGGGGGGDTHISNMQFWEQVGSQQQQTQQTQQTEEEEGGQHEGASQQKQPREAAAGRSGSEAAAAAAAAGGGGAGGDGDRGGARRSLFSEFIATGRMPGDDTAQNAAAAGTQRATPPAAGGSSSVPGSEADGSSAQALLNNTRSDTAAASGGGHQQAGAAAAESNDWVLVDAPAQAGAPSTQGSQSLVQPGGTVSAGRLLSVCAAAGSVGGPDEQQQATGSAPQAAADNSTPPDDPAAKRQRQGE